MKKTLVLSLLVLLVVSLGSVAAFAANDQTMPMPGKGSCPMMMQNHPNMTDEQKAQIAQWQQQRMEMHKQMLAKQVEWGWITQVDADQCLSRMANHQGNGPCGQGMMMGQGKHGGHHGQGMNHPCIQQ